jgi:hypothetical protein
VRKAIIQIVVSTKTQSLRVINNSEGRKQKYKLDFSIKKGILFWILSFKQIAS